MKLNELRRKLTEDVFKIECERPNPVAGMRGGIAEAIRMIEIEDCVHSALIALETRGLINYE